MSSNTSRYPLLWAVEALYAAFGQRVGSDINFFWVNFGGLLGMKTGGDSRGGDITDVFDE
jgi:hypothetical protein